MAAIVAFRNSLRITCGLSNAAAEAIIAQGYDSPDDLRKLKDSDHEGIPGLVHHTLKAAGRRSAAAAAARAAAIAANDPVIPALPEVVEIPHNSVNKLKAYRYWAILMDRIDQPALAGNFTVAALAFTETVIQEREARKEGSPDPPKPVPQLKSLDQWRSFWERFDGLMSQTIGAAEIPINYVYRPHEAVDAAMLGADYASSDERYYATTCLSKKHYTEDRKRVYAALRDLVLDGPGWAFIQQFERTQNGRDAVLGLKAQAEGRSAVTTRKQLAYAKVDKARYSGPRKTWSFQNYIQTHQLAHAELERLGEPVAESKKVTDFLAGITDARLANGKDLVLGDPAKLNDFQATQQYLATLVANKSVNASREREISEVHTEGKGPKIHGGTYSNADWKALGKEGQARVRRLRDQQLKKTEAKRKGKAKGKKRQVEEVKTDKDKESDSSDDDAQFGPAAHKKKK